MLITFVLYIKINVLYLSSNQITFIMSNTNRPLSVIATEITNNWENVNYGAVPYLNALKTLNSIDDMFNQDSADSVVRYFLSNASSWRGETARRVKKELNAMLKK